MHNAQCMIRVKLNRRHFFQKTRGEWRYRGVSFGRVKKKIQYSLKHQNDCKIKKKKKQNR